MVHIGFQSWLPQNLEKYSFFEKVSENPEKQQKMFENNTNQGEIGE